MVYPLINIEEGFVLSYIYRYQLKNKICRPKVNLNKYRKGIEQAIKSVFGSSLIEKCIRIEKEYFEFRINFGAPKTMLQQMGRLIAEKVPEIREFSFQNNGIFIRKPNRYYSYLEDKRTEGNKIYYIFGLVDSIDFQEACEKIEFNFEIKLIDKMIKDLSIFGLEITTDKSANFAPYSWYYFDERGSSSKKQGIELLGDYTILQTPDTTDNAVSSEEMIYYIERPIFFDVSIKEKKNLQEFFNIDKMEEGAGNPLSTIRQFNNDNLHTMVYDVGQGLCSAICDADYQPVMYFDFGAAYGKHKNTYKDPCEFESRNDTPIILSHWDKDHWYGVKYSPEFIKRKWIVPKLVRNNPESIKLMYDIRRNGELWIWPKNKLIFSCRLGIVFKCECTKHKRNKHNSGLGFLFNVNGANKDILFPGDNSYESIPKQFKEGIGGLVATHHGGKYCCTRADSRQIPPAVGEGKIIYSYGEPNDYGHPTSVEDHKRKGWSKVMSTVNGNCIV